jgi:hypothetical protein
MERASMNQQMTSLKAEFDSRCATLQTQIESARKLSTEDIAELARQLRRESEDMKAQLTISIQSLEAKMDGTQSSIVDLRSQIAERVTLTLVGELRSDLDSLRENCALKADLQELVQKCAKKTEFDSLSQTSATQTDIEELRRISAKKSEFDSLKKNCAMKSDVDKLRADCLARSEFDSLKQNCVQKADLEELNRNCVKRSEIDSLKQNFAAKTDLNSLQQNCATKADLTQLRRDVGAKAEFDFLKHTAVTKDDLTRRYGHPVPFEIGSPFKGIIHYLTGLHQGNIHDLRIVTVTSSSIAPSERHRVPQNVVDFASERDFFSDDLPDQWICFEFKNHRVQISHYSVRSFSGTRGRGHPKSWVIEGSNDDASWIILDQRSGNSQLNGSLLPATFPVTDIALCRFIRLRQTDVNHFGSHHLLLAAFELFGSLRAS